MVRQKIGRGPYLFRSLVMLMTTYKLLRWMYSTRWLDGRVVTSENVLDWYRGEEAGDLKRSELNGLVENLTCLNAFEVENLDKQSENRDE